MITQAIIRKCNNFVQMERDILLSHLKGLIVLLKFSKLYLSLIRKEKLINLIKLKVKYLFRYTYKKTEYEVFNKIKSK